MRAARHSDDQTGEVDVGKPKTGDLERAQEIYHGLLPAIHGIMGVGNYGATTAKAALQLVGVLDNRRVRLPLLELDDAELSALRTSLESAGLLS